ncbi:uncharacterized protein NMK_3355 [Novimethylophilus kurashikiensis]|uniref:Uncharacterized protein n=1 Tax=Novimethylophilus kurashikiensis TaxID=1825523 RepID=A0A2R5FIN9_9PROT|nr:hypothetical protein [Novimethylophilus kurashikiensis]GBG15744.1 uncharacterized protein NMK_3355 [Novimethylophilus kurashikiensis]
MFKYQNQKTKKPDSIVTTLLAVLQAALVLIGIIGISVKFFDEQNGLLRQWFDYAISAKLSNLVVIGILIVAGVYLFNWWVKGSDQKHSAVGNILMYGMMAVGAYVLFNFLSN